MDSDHDTSIFTSYFYVIHSWIIKICWKYGDRDHITISHLLELSDSKSSKSILIHAVVKAIYGAREQT